MNTPENATIPRRHFIQGVGGLAIGAAAACLAFPRAARADAMIARTAGLKLKLSLNAYSFNGPLRAGTMAFDDVIRFCAEQGIDGLDATGYYMPGYPKAPGDDYVYRLKRTAFVNGVSISGTGARNDFTKPDAASRKADVQLIKNWIEVASKLGAPVLRIFSGSAVPAGHTFDDVLAWMADDIRECADCGGRHGVIVAVQPHDDYLKTADQVIRLANAVNSDWFGVILDIGSLRQGDPYAEIEKLVPYAVSWQIKEQVYSGNTAIPVDLKRLKGLIDKSGYRGFLPVEALDARNSSGRVAKFMAQVRQEFAL
jgi:sugar phosphate isomerase/epimerase